MIKKGSLGFLFYMPALFLHFLDISRDLYRNEMSEFVKSIQLQYEIPNKNHNKKPMN
ncbi:hypothetical protein AMTRI_Chr01g102340 [Amborella trichopoda]